MENYQAKTMKLEDGEYVPVHERIKEFYSTYPTGAIQTTVLTSLENLKEGSLIVVKCYVFRDKEDTHPVIAHSQAKHDLDYFKSSALEIAETSAVGRALGNLNIGIRGVFATADEVEKSKSTAKQKKSTPKMTSETSNFDSQLDILSKEAGDLVKKIYASKTEEELKTLAETIKKSGLDEESKTVLRKSYNQKNKELKAQKEK